MVNLIGQNKPHVWFQMTSIVCLDESLGEIKILSSGWMDGQVRLTFHYLPGWVIR